MHKLDTSLAISIRINDHQLQISPFKPKENLLNLNAKTTIQSPSEAQLKSQQNQLSKSFADQSILKQSNSQNKQKTQNLLTIEAIKLSQTPQRKMTKNASLPQLKFKAAKKLSSNTNQDQSLYLLQKSALKQEETTLENTSFNDLQSIKQLSESQQKNKHRLSYLGEKRSPYEIKSHQNLTFDSSLQDFTLSPIRNDHQDSQQSNTCKRNQLNRASFQAFFDLNNFKKQIMEKQQKQSECANESPQNLTKQQNGKSSKQ